MTHITTRQFQDFLSQISDCFIERDLSAWRDSIELPFSLITSKGAAVLNDETEVEQNFNLYLKACECMNLDQIIRIVKSLEDCQDGTWIGTYETHLMSRGQRATRPYTSSILLVPEDNRIKAVAILNARGTDEWVSVGLD